MKDNTPLKKQIEILGNFIMTNFPDELGRDGRNEGAIELTMRLLKDYHPTYIDYQRKLKELTKLILLAINHE